MSVAVLVSGGLPVSVAVLVSGGLPEPVAVLVAVELPLPVAVVVADTLRLVVGCSDFDGDAFGGVGTRLTPAGAELTVLPGCVPLADELGRCEAEWDGGEIVVLVPPGGVAALLLDSSTATIAMMPIADAPIPA